MPRSNTSADTIPPGERVAQSLPSSPALPGEAAVDEQLVATALAEINSISRTKGLELATAVGEYVLRNFFDGSYAVFNEKGDQHKSFKALSESEELSVGPTFLWYSVKLIEQLRALPVAVGTALPLSHHRLLIHVKDDEMRLDLATEAVEQGLSKRELEQLIRERRELSRDGGGKPGRPVLPVWYKAAGNIRKAVLAATADGLTVASVVHLGPEKGRERLAEIEESMALLAEFKENLQRALADPQFSAQDAL